MTGFGCKVIAYDLYRNPQCEAIGVQYMELSELFSQSDITTLHCPLTPENYHLINKEAITYGRLRQRPNEGSCDANQHQ